MVLTRRGFLVSGAAAALLADPARGGIVRAAGGRAFAAPWRAVTGTDAPAGAIERIVGRVVDRIDRGMSPYRHDSALSRFNRSRDTDWQPVPGALAGLAATALAAVARTGGAFDPTVGPLVARYGFGPIAGRGADVAALDAGAGRLRKSDPWLTLDLCGIAKGYALDLILDDCRAAGIGGAMVELGGEIRTLGRHPDGRDWRVGLDDPRAVADGLRLHRVVAPRGRAVATSGHAVQSHAGPAGTASHLIDPRRNRPADPSLASVTVLAAEATWADALATALAAMGPEDGPDLAAGQGIDALFLVADGAELREVFTGAFAAHVIG